MYIFRNRNIENALMVVCPPAGCGIITSGRKHHHFCTKNGANLQRKTACGAASGCKAAADREHIRGRGSLRPPFAHQDTHPGTGEGCRIFLSTGVREVFSAIREKAEKFCEKRKKKRRGFCPNYGSYTRKRTQERTGGRLRVYPCRRPPGSKSFQRRVQHRSPTLHARIFPQTG